MIGEEEGLEDKVHMDGARLKRVSEFKYLVCVLDASGIDVAECCEKLGSGRKEESCIYYQVLH